MIFVQTSLQHQSRQVAGNCSSNKDWPASHPDAPTANDARKQAPWTTVWPSRLRHSHWNFWLINHPHHSVPSSSTCRHPLSASQAGGAGSSRHASLPVALRFLSSPEPLAWPDGKMEGNEQTWWQQLLPESLFGWLQQTLAQKCQSRALCPVCSLESRPVLPQPHLLKRPLCALPKLPLCVSFCQSSCGLQACCEPASLALSTCAARGPVATCLPPAAMMQKHRLSVPLTPHSTKSANRGRRCSCSSCRYAASDRGRRCSCSSRHCTTSSSCCSSKPCEETSTTSTLHCRYSSTERGRVHFLSSAELLILLEDFCMDLCTWWYISFCKPVVGLRILFF